MAIVAVNATKLGTGTGNNCSSAVNATAHNALLVGAGWFRNPAGGPFTVTRTGDTFTTDVQGASITALVAVASAPNVVSGSQTLTATGSGASSGVVAFVLEVSGLATSNILDGTPPATNTATSSSGSTGSVSNVSADAICVAVWSTAAGGTISIASTGSNWSDTANSVTMTETAGSSFEATGMAYNIVSAIASQQETWTVTSTTWQAALAIYQAAVSYLPVADPIYVHRRS